ncbi:MAG: ABC transporter substrate-binding protein [bacterium]|nr:ABC transporter substrate-binding protein [bacterium]
MILAGLCGCGERQTLVVGAKNFTEQLVLGEILAQHLENRLGVEVDRRLNLNGTLLAHQALIHGEIDLYPEYTGTALMAILDLEPGYDPTEVHERVRQHYLEHFQVDWMPPFGFNNSFVMVVRGQDAREHGLESVSDAAAAPVDWALGVGYEFETRPDGLPALQRAYPINWGAAPKTMDLGLLYRALDQGQVTMIAANGTDGMLAKLDVKVLADDKQIFPPYEAAVAVRSAALAKYPGLGEALRELSGSIDATSMQQLNYALDGEHQPLAQVAASFLANLTTPQR